MQRTITQGEKESKVYEIDAQGGGPQKEPGGPHKEPGGPQEPGVRQSKLRGQGGRWSRLGRLGSQLRGHAGLLPKMKERREERKATRKKGEWKGRKIEIRGREGRTKLWEGIGALSEKIPCSRAIEQYRAQISCPGNSSFCIFLL